MPAYDITVYAKWVTGGFTITFDLNGAEGTNPEISGTYDTPIDSADIPAAPERLGYLFGGWYTTSACTTQYTFVNYPGENVTVYAKWTLISYYYKIDGSYQAYTVNFYRNQSSTDTVKQTVVTSESQYDTVTVPDPTAAGSSLQHSSNTNATSYPLSCKQYTSNFKQNYMFVGWYTDRSCTTPANIHGSLEDMADANGTVNLYAKWVQNAASRQNSLLTTTEGSFYRVCPYCFDGGSSGNFTWYYVNYPVYVSGSYTLSLLNYKPSTSTTSTYLDKNFEIIITKSS